MTYAHRALSAVALALLVVTGRPTLAQQSAPQDSFAVVDRIVAVVGDSVITMTQLEEELNFRRQQGVTIPTDPAALARLQRTLLDSIIDGQLVVQAALRDTSITVTEQEVQTAVDRAVRQIRSEFSSELEYRHELEAANFGTPQEYRRWMADQQRHSLLQQKLLDKMREKGDLAPLAPTESELRAYYEQMKALWPKRPASVSFHQIVVRVEPDSAALAAARHLADSLVGVLRGGADFAQVARRYSDDPTTKDQGGELGWIRRGNFVPEFEAVAFDPRLQPGQISNPVKTVFGYHIIQVERRQPAESQVRHILIAPTLTEADRARARQRAEHAAQELLNGQPYDSVAARYHDFRGQEQTLVEDFPRDSLPQVYQDALTGAEPGDVIGPIQLDLGDGRPKFAVIRFDAARPEGEYSFDEMRDGLRRQLAERNAMDRFLAGLRKSTYIEIRL